LTAFTFVSLYINTLAGEIRNMAHALTTQPNSRSG